MSLIVGVGDFYRGKCCLVHEDNEIVVVNLDGEEEDEDEGGKGRRVRRREGVGSAKRNSERGSGC